MGKTDVYDMGTWDRLYLTVVKKNLINIIMFVVLNQVQVQVQLIYKSSCKYSKFSFNTISHGDTQVSYLAYCSKINMTFCLFTLAMMPMSLSIRHLMQIVFAFKSTLWYTGILPF